MEIFQQLGELFLEAVPTVIVVFLFYLFLRAGFFKPMERVLAERRARIDGARRAAEAGQAAAQEKTRSYHEAVRKARSNLYAEQEAARRTVLDERAGLLRNTRSAANDRIRAAKQKISDELTVARAQLEKESQALATEVVRAVLQRWPAGPPTSSEAS